MIREVKYLPAQLCLDPLCCVDVLEKRDVPALEPRASQDIATGAAECAGLLLGKGLGIEIEIPVTGSVGERVMSNVGIPDEVPGLVEVITNASDIVPTPDRQRLAALEHRHSRDLPSSSNLLVEPVLIAPERELIDVVQVQQVCSIKVRYGPETAVIERIEQQVSLVVRVAGDL